MRRKLTLTGSFCLLLACMLLTLPLKWILAALIAAAVHELCHYAAIRLLGGSASAVQLTGNAAIMPVASLSSWKELLCTLAGPMGGFLLVFLLPVFPRIALCGLLQSFYNLLPLYPQDGGRALKCLASMLLPPTYAWWLCSFVSWLCVGGIVALGIYAALFKGLGIFPLLLSIAIAAKAIYACKAGQMGLQ